MNSQNEKEALNALVGINEMIQEQTYVSMSKFFNDLFSAFSSKFKNEIIPEIVEQSYTGIHLNTKYEQGDFLQMIESFRNGQILHAKYVYQILTDAINLFQTFPNITECNLSTTQLSGAVIVGDLHGSFKDLYYIISKYGIPGSSYAFVFNGDFVDRGPQQSEVLITLLYAFLLNPSNVFLNRGNHEDLSLNLNKHFNPNFKKDTELKFGKYALAIFNQSQRLFRRLPLATIVQNRAGLKIFITHGGLSSRLDLNYINTQLDRFRFSSITLSQNDSPNKRKMAEQLSDLLWSDPMTNNNGCIPNNHRGIGFLFGPDVSESFCKKYGFSTVVRSHEVRENGVTRDHPYCFTVFSSSRYCGGDNEAGIILVDSNRADIKIKTFNTRPLNADEFDNNKRLLIQNFKAYLMTEADELIKKFRKEDHQGIGSIDINKWAKILSDHVNIKNGVNIQPKHFITLKDYLCPCDDMKATADYKFMFKQVQNQTSNQLFELLDVLFNLIDIDGNGSISKSEANEAVNLINKTLGTTYDSSFISNMDSNRNGKVEIEEFRTAFSKAYNL